MRVTYGNGTLTIYGSYSTEAPAVGTVLTAEGAINEVTRQKAVAEGDSFVDINAKKVYLNNGTSWVEW